MERLQLHFGTDINGSQMMKPNDLGNALLLNSPVNFLMDANKWDAHPQSMNCYNFS